MKFKINIEEIINKEFEIEAETAEIAIESAIKKYKSGEFVLENPYVTGRKIAVSNPEVEETEWVEF